MRDRIIRVGERTRDNMSRSRLVLVSKSKIQRVISETSHLITPYLCVSCELRSRGGCIIYHTRKMSTRSWADENQVRFWFAANSVSCSLASIRVRPQTRAGNPLRQCRQEDPLDV